MRYFVYFLRTTLAFTLTLITLFSWPALPHIQSQSAHADSLNILSTLHKPDQSTLLRVSEKYGRLPMSFEVNRGQVDSQVKFVSRSTGYGLWLTATEAVMELRNAECGMRNEKGFGYLFDPKNPQSAIRNPLRNAESGKQNKKGFGDLFNAKNPQSAIRNPQSNVLRMKLVGANPAPKIEGLDPLPGHTNYFIGNDSRQWRTHVPTFTRVRYKEVYQGIDVIYYGNQSQVEYDFVLAPGAEPRAITLAFQGAQKMRIDVNGDLVLSTSGGEIRQKKPNIYQEVEGSKRPVGGHYLIKGRHQVGFQIETYDLTRPLVIDPVLIYSTYLGGAKDEIGFGIAVDAAGSAYVTGKTLSANFPTANPLQPAVAGETSEVFVTKLNPAGSAMVYSTYLGGSSGDIGMGIAVDSMGSAYVAGLTFSDNFPIRNPAQQNRGGNSEAFVAKLNPAGSAIIYSTYIGGSNEEFGFGVALDSAGNAYVTGMTNSTNFPTRNALQTTFGGGNTAGFFIDAFITKINAAGTEFVYSTYLGGSGDDGGLGIAVDTAGNAYLTGVTTSSNFPKVNALQATIGGGQMLGADAFVTKVNATGAGIVYSTYLGGSGDDLGFGIVVDGTGSAYVTGATASTNFPTRNPIQPTFAGGVLYRTDAFLTRIAGDGSALVLSTFLGGSGDEFGFGIGLGPADRIYVSGSTSSTDFPNKKPVQPGFGGAGSAHRSDAFVVSTDGEVLSYATYVGGRGDDLGFGLAVDAAGNAYLTGASASLNFPTKDPVQPALAGTSRELGDAFITKLSFDPGNPMAITVSAASFLGGTLARESIVSSFGVDIANTISGATAIPLPTSLSGTRVRVRDGAGVERLAPLFFISPGQINFQVPPQSADGMGLVTVTNGNAAVATGPLTIGPVSPGLFSANSNGRGVAAAVALRVRADQSQQFEPVSRLDTTLNPPQFVSVPIDLGPESDQVFLLLFGTGIRFRSAVTAVSARVGGADARVDFAGEAPGFIALDQVNALLPRSLMGAGEVDVVLTVDGVPSNTVRVNIR